MRRSWAWLAIGALLLLGCCVFGCVGLLVISRTMSTALPLGDAVGIVYIEGPITMGYARSSGEAAYSETIVEYLREATADSSIKAIVLRVESPGGSVVASREIYDAVAAARAKGKPVIASMGETAASGGYYVSAGADKIYAEAATITGSIGVISVIPNVEGLADKVGIKMIVIKSGAHKDESYGFRDLTPDERGIWQAVINEAYEDFTGIVASGRHMDIAAVKKLADGRIYTGKQAKDNGLVDEIGGLDAAVDAAAKAAGISGTPRRVKYRLNPGLLESLTSTFSPGSAIRDVTELFDMHQWGRVMYLYVAP
ncbi:MAG: signal peptide peptidase SppA [Acidobacteriota bacterium]